MNIINPFQNGNRRIARLTILKLAWGIIVMMVIQIEGYLPTLDFLTPKQEKLITFCLAAALTLSKGVEMFFDQTLQLFQNHEIPTGDTVMITKDQVSKPFQGSQDQQSLNQTGK